MSMKQWEAIRKLQRGLKEALRNRDFDLARRIAGQLRIVSPK